MKKSAADDFAIADNGAVQTLCSPNPERGPPRILKALYGGDFLMAKKKKKEDMTPKNPKNPKKKFLSSTSRTEN